MIKKYNSIESKMKREAKKEISANRWDRYALIPGSKRLKMIERAWEVTYEKRYRKALSCAIINFIQSLSKEVLYRPSIIRANAYSKKFKNKFKSVFGYEITDVRRFYPEGRRELDIISNEYNRNKRIRKEGEEDE